LWRITFHVKYYFVIFYILSFIYSILFRPTIQSTTMYRLQTGSDIIIPFCRLSLSRDSFVPATVRKWNSLNLSVCNLDTLSKFKKATRCSTSIPIPRHYYYGPRKLNIYSFKTTCCNASFLNYDWCKVEILSNASCNCSTLCEICQQFIFDCDKYTDNKGILFDSLIWLTFMLM
jgi:hypothetical protein